MKLQNMPGSPKCIVSRDFEVSVGALPDCYVTKLSDAHEAILLEIIKPNITLVKLMVELACSLRSKMRSFYYALCTSLLVSGAYPRRNVRICRYPLHSAFLKLLPLFCLTRCLCTVVETEAALKSC